MPRIARIKSIQRSNRPVRVFSPDGECFYDAEAALRSAATIEPRLIECRHLLLRPRWGHISIAAAIERSDPTIPPQTYQKYIESLDGGMPVICDSVIIAGALTVASSDGPCEAVIVQKAESPLYREYEARDIGAEYAAYCRALAVMHAVPSNKNRYEVENIVERFMMVLASGEMVESALDKMCNELIRRGFMIELQRASVCARVVSALLLKTSVPVGTKIHYDDSVFALSSPCSEISWPMTTRLKELIRIGGPCNVARLLLQYGSILAGGQHLGLPIAHFEEMRALLDISVEGFASPLNARFLSNYCSIFELDMAFGSRGNFFSQELIGRWFINPPFIETVLCASARKVLPALSCGLEVACCLLPVWDDCEGVCELVESRFARLVVRKKFIMQKSNSTGLFRAKFECYYVLLMADSAVDMEIVMAAKKSIERY